MIKYDTKTFFTEGGIQVLHLQLLGEGEFMKMQMYAKQGEGVISRQMSAYYIFLIEHLIHKLLTIVTRFFVSFIKILVLLKT